MPKNDPMKERRDALDLAIQALDALRSKYTWGVYATPAKIEGGSKALDKVHQIGRAIQILTAMKDEGPLL